jgi:hypothetical protein
MALSVGEFPTVLPPLNAWDSISIGIEKFPRLQNLEFEATGYMEHIIHWIYNQLRAVSLEGNNPLQTLDISIINKHIKTQRPYTVVWAALDAMLSDRKRFPWLRFMDIRLVRLGLWSLTVDPTVVAREIVGRMPRLTKMGILKVHHD